MLADITRLSGPEFHGRQTGASDDMASGRLIAERFAALGLKDPTAESSPPHRTPWSQTERVSATLIGPDPHLNFQTGSRSVLAHAGTDFLPIMDSPSIDRTAPVVFVGYGLSDPARHFDEYEGVDVKNRVALFLRGKPDGYPLPVSLRDKQRIAREKGAIAFLMVVGPVLTGYEARKGLGGKPLAIYTQEEEGQFPLPGAWISTDFAESTFAGVPPTSARSWREIQDQLNHLVPQSVATPVSVSFRLTSSQTQGVLTNVLGLLLGADPAHEDETIVIGAHRDHFGQQGGLLFPGADDNASGTAVLLEAARVLSQSRNPPARTILFASFSGEEPGLLGSKIYVEREIRPLKTTVAMINVDHAGVGNGRLTVGITGFPNTVAKEVARRAGLADKIDVFGFFPGGDHVPFHEAGVSTITVVSGGVHPHFHQPSDTADTVQPEILEATARYVLALTSRLASEADESTPPLETKFTRPPSRLFSPTRREPYFTHPAPGAPRRAFSQGPALWLISPAIAPTRPQAPCAFFPWPEPASPALRPVDAPLHGVLNNRAKEGRSSSIRYQGQKTAGEAEREELTARHHRGACH